MPERPAAARQRLLDALLVERFTPYRPAPALPPTAREVADHIRRVTDRPTPRRKATP